MNSQEIAEIRALQKTLADNHKDVMSYIDSILSNQTTKVILDVPWLSQLGPTADYAPGDCGPACLAMWLRFLGWDVTVDEVSLESTLARGYRYTRPWHIMHAANHWGVDLYWRKNTSTRPISLETLRAEIDAGRPCIVLVHYPYLPVKFDFNYNSGHWLLVIGYTDDSIIYADPYWRTDGIKTVSNEAFYRAWNNNHLDGNSNRQVLRMR